jgi:hypothetical protein
MEKSKGHISFSFDKKWELFEKNGEVFIAPVDNAIMTDGRRVGRWESSISHFMHFAALYRDQFEYLPEMANNRF